jgi:hypothetical protein
LDDLQADYFVKQKKDQVEEEGIFAVVKGKEGKEGKESGARSGRE